MKESNEMAEALLAWYEKRQGAERATEIYKEDGSDVPGYVPAENKAKWAKTWNAAFKRYGSEERAFAIANAAWGPKKKEA